MIRVQDRFIKYVKIHSTSDPTNEVNPSSERERDIAKVLYDEMISLGMTGVTLSDNCYVYGFIEATKGYENAPKIGFIAHMDTSPDFSGENVDPIVHENYDGGDIVLKERTIKVSDFPHLTKLKGRTLITSDGTTLLGADDKAGIAEIMYVCDKIITENI
jgi:tripeptide aminopeptidase